jgi:hypothetical protein
MSNAEKVEAGAEHDEGESIHDICPMCEGDRLYGMCWQCGYCGPGHGLSRDELDEATSMKSLRRLPKSSRRRWGRAIRRGYAPESTRPTRRGKVRRSEP